ncbi:uncharacterized protein si:dkey-1h6.8 [Pangasianodon hypophthalmus]|uniref:uncharacterized protein si:dkey-1h6.8 n=1 Tax=Pangasianodon hypophthalmus TaxID=310915 RepID=UPI00147C000E|nr:uncharacterized protein si:dkey-1h6.8 [Pangasianodon hypophthalmus]
MATEESNGAEFQEKTGLKRKLTGPPRLLLGKTRSPGQDEKKSRKHRRPNNDDTPMDTEKDQQSTELHELTSPESPETLLTTELDGGPCMDLQDERLETTSNLEENTKKRRRRSKAGATIRRIFSCVRRRKELGMKAVEDAEENTNYGGHNSIQDKELLTHPCDSLKMKHEQEQGKKISARKFKVRMWHIFRKHSSKGKQEREEHEGGRCNDTFTEISSETSVDRYISGPAEPPAVDEQQNESSGINEDATRIHEENCLESRDPKNEVMEMISLDVEVNVDSNAVFVHENHQHPSESHFPCLVDEEEPKIQISEAPLTGIVESSSDLEDSRMSPEDLVTDDMVVDVPVENANVFKCKPVITIEDVHSSDEENDDLFENTAPQYGTLSPLLALNGSCYTLKTSDNRFSEILLAQTALSLVRAAISGAVEQLSAELQSRQMDRDHV